MSIWGAGTPGGPRARLSPADKQMCWPSRPPASCPLPPRPHACPNTPLLQSVCPPGASSIAGTGLACGSERWPGSRASQAARQAMVHWGLPGMRKETQMFRCNPLHFFLFFFFFNLLQKILIIIFFFKVKKKYKGIREIKIPIRSSPVVQGVKDSALSPQWLGLLLLLLWCGFSLWSRNFHMPWVVRGRSDYIVFLYSNREASNFFKDHTWNIWKFLG